MLLLVCGGDGKVCLVEVGREREKGSGSEVGSTGESKVMVVFVVGDDMEGAGCGRECDCVGR